MARTEMQLAASCLLTCLLAVAAVTVAADEKGPIGTVVTLFTGPYFTNVPATDAPIIFRAPPPEASCVNLPTPVAGRVGSAQIQWNVAPADGAGGNRAMCGEVWFWRQQDCEGRGTGWQLKDLASASVDRYDYRRERIPLFPEKFVGAKSMSCAKYLPNACSALTCGANAKCVLHDGEGVCQCKRGFVLKDGQCVHACADAVCPYDARCVVEAGDTAVCHCVNPNFLFTDGKCEAVCATRCPADAQCKVEDGRMNCECPDGKRLRDGACVDPCSGVACPADTSCVAAAGVPRCVCASGVLTATGCVDTTGDAIVDSYLKPHNEARAAVGSPALLWDADLAAKAQAWVATLAQAERCRLEHPAELLESASKPYGQNLAALCCKSRISTARAINVWVGEGSHYDTAPLLLQDGDAGGCSTGDWRDCGHYTQVVWKATTHVGCASGPCGSVGWTAWVCNYSPPGNEKGLAPY